MLLMKKLKVELNYNIIYLINQPPLLHRDIALASMTTCYYHDCFY